MVYMVSATVASISPTPGGLGAMEAALVAGITRLGVPAGEAVAAVLSFRVATFWLPLPVGAWLLRLARRREWA
ncbi:MAG: flippase-like domain-containing protein [Acidimicrobiia bacterium]|nr:flippase-like domain-containing protein [Acidimicrobiia bacterium]